MCSDLGLKPKPSTVCALTVQESNPNFLVHCTTLQPTETHRSGWENPLLNITRTPLLSKTEHLTMHRLMGGNLVCRVSWPGRQKTWLIRGIFMVQQGLSHFVRPRGEALVPKERRPGRTEWGRGNPSDNPFLRLDTCGQRELHPRQHRGC